MGKRATPPVGGAAMLLGRCGAQVASQQSPILRRGKVKNTLDFSGLQATTKRLPTGTPIPRSPKAETRER